MLNWATIALRRKNKRPRAGSGSPCSRDCNLARLRSGGHGGRDLCVGIDRERGRFPAKSDLCGLGEADSSDRHNCSRRAAGRSETLYLRVDPEYFVALQAAGGGCDGHKAGGRSCGNDGRQIRAGFHTRRGRRSVEGDCG
jgi:hypothetical protein